MKLQKSYQRSGEDYYKEIVKSFGEEILVNSTKEIDRPKLARIVFNNKAQKEELDRLTSVYVVRKIKEEIDKTKTNIILDVPLLFETNLDKECDITIGVIAEEKTCIKRICKRDRINEEQAIARLNNQKTTRYFKQKCDYIINNEQNVNIEKQIKDILNRRQFIEL